MAAPLMAALSALIFPKWRHHEVPHVQFKMARNSFPGRVLKNNFYGVFSPRGLYIWFNFNSILLKRYSSTELFL